MIGKEIKRYCRDDISKIENYDLAIADTEQLWDCHHRLEITNSFICNKDLLIELNLYYHRPAEELIFLTHSNHAKLHWKKNENVSNKGKIFSEFGNKFKEHFGITNADNPKLYAHEYNWYYNHKNKCSWEK